MEFRVDFYFRIVMDFLFYAVNILFYRILFLHTSLLAGWSEAQVMVFISGNFILDALNMTLFSNNMWWIPALVNKGDLDYYLVRPVSTLFFISLRDFAANSFLNLILAFAIFIWALHGLPNNVGLGKAVLYLGYLGIGLSLYYCMNLLMLLPVFWTHSARGLVDIFWSLTRLSERPDRIYMGWIRKILVTVMPFCLIASFPARLLLEPFDLSIFLHLAGVTVLFAFAVLVVWSFALKNYSSASS